MAESKQMDFVLDEMSCSATNSHSTMTSDGNWRENSSNLICQSLPSRHLHRCRKTIFVSCVLQHSSLINNPFHS